VVAPIKKVKWLITGGEGQLGRAMALELSKGKCDFVSLSHSELDITNKAQILEWFTRESPDVVLNCAAWTNVDLAEDHEASAWSINAEGPKWLAEECSRMGTKFIHISTDYVFSGASNKPWSEGEARAPLSAYGRTKADGERLVLNAYPAGTYLVRTGWLYSPWGKNFVRTMIKKALEDSNQIDVVGDQIGQPTSAIDLAEQIHGMVQRDVAPGIYHGTNSGQASWFEFAQKVFALLDQDIGRIHSIKAIELARPALRPSFSVLGHDRWSQEGMKTMRNWQIALEETMPALLISRRIGE
jgi:dTDP-4-dehydrorhamnose reductase